MAGPIPKLAIYAHGKVYTLRPASRTPLHPNLCRDYGLLVHLPPSGGCRVILLDLARGWQAAQLAAQVRDLRALKADGWRVA